MARKRSGLSADDLEVWSRVAGTVTPLDPPVPIAPPVPVERITKLRAKPVGSVPPMPAPRRSLVTVDTAPDPMRGLVDQPLRMDKRVHGRLKRGKIEPDARIDLHGMTEARAHRALTGFLLRAQAEGARVVLVITGKGRRPEGHRMTEVPGVLRRAVPHWLRDAPLAGIVLQILQAHDRHGGAGAYYVYLKRRR